MEPQADEQAINTTGNPAGSEQAKKSLREALKEAQEKGREKRADMPTTFESAQARIEHARDRIHDASSAILRKISSLGRKILDPIDEVKDIVEGLREPDSRQKVLDTAVTLMQEKALAAVDAVIIPELRMGIVNTAKNTAVVARAGLEHYVAADQRRMAESRKRAETVGRLITKAAEIPRLITMLLENVGQGIEGRAQHVEQSLQTEAANRRRESYLHIGNAVRTRYGARRLTEIARGYGMKLVEKAKDALVSKQQEKELTGYDRELVDRFRDMLEQVNWPLTVKIFDNYTPQQQRQTAFFAVKTGRYLNEFQIDYTQFPILAEMRDILNQPKQTSGADTQPDPLQPTTQPMYQDGIMSEPTQEEVAGYEAARANFINERAQRAFMETGNAELNPTLELPRAGEKFSITKIDVHGTSQLETGVTLEGTLRDDIRIGSQIYVGNANTSPVTKIEKTDTGEILFTTETSTYRLNNSKKVASSGVSEQIAPDHSLNPRTNPIL